MKLITTILCLIFANAAADGVARGSVAGQQQQSVEEVEGDRSLQWYPMRMMMMMRMRMMMMNTPAPGYGRRKLGEVGSTTKVVGGAVSSVETTSASKGESEATITTDRDLQYAMRMMMMMRMRMMMMTQAPAKTYYGRQLKETTTTSSALRGDSEATTEDRNLQYAMRMMMMMRMRMMMMTQAPAKVYGRRQLSTVQRRAPAEEVEVYYPRRMMMMMRMRMMMMMTPAPTKAPGTYRRKLLEGKAKSPVLSQLKSNNHKGAQSNHNDAAQGMAAS